jgi:hypothetical protein
VQLNLKCEIIVNEINHEELLVFLNSNNFIELGIRGLSKNLSLNENIYRSLRYLKIDNPKFIDLTKFSSL